MRWVGLFVLALAAGCGTSASPTAPTPVPPTQVTVEYAGVGGRSGTWTLACPGGGSHPDPQRACAVLDAHAADTLLATPTGRVCSQRYGGPERAEVHGSWRGRPVAARLHRTDGCGIAQWALLEGLLPPVRS